MKLSNVLCRPKLDTILDTELYQARRDLLNASANAEHWASAEQMLEARIQRLDTLRSKTIVIAGPAQ